ncbi:Peptidoglycan O-acetyltransferase [Fundidesulfovibrio magnetotacticus]|uniref:Peptidoglycan O-acetyltransferase n=1 Tax=Fundidesulfovibrio magnetotacticus TaxID=2730080 RepID=A0A6V8LRX3_9BACT|nr:MBOAT family protein [Fundidesulfovibrio magnetotacticus]GFK93078.1 Peptidoglycan O-acetyltransferase [Fundidesulfovibrio magnetotacticus]
MQLLSVEFAVFFLVVLALAWAVRTRPAAFRSVLLAASYVFYAGFHAGFAALLAGVSLLTWWAGLALAGPWQGRARTGILTGYLALVLGELCVFKYWNLASELTGLLPELSLALPVGISFFTFQGVGYVMDVYRRPEEAQRSALDVFLFMAFFPTLLSGPILRARDFIPQLRSGAPAWTDASQAFWLIVLGLFKKVALSSYLSEHATRQLFSGPEHFSSPGALLGVLAYSAQIYCDFSGYSDLAQGLAGLLGLRAPDNFNQPYKARNLREFWQGWHISLSTWLRDYLYIPLGGSRCAPARRNLNLLVTMGLGGLWHGAGLNFLAWGLLHGGGLVVTHAFSGRLPTPGTPAGRRLADAACWAGTFAFVTLAWVFFAAPDFDTAARVLGRMAALDGSGQGPTATLAVVTLGVIAYQALRLDWLRTCPRPLAMLPAPAQAAALGFLGALIVRMGPDGMLPFIYFSF